MDFVVVPLLLLIVVDGAISLKKRVWLVYYTAAFICSQEQISCFYFKKKQTLATTTLGKLIES